jgi:hypothetical protein
VGGAWLRLPLLLLQYFVADNGQQAHDHAAKRQSRALNIILPALTSLRRLSVTLSPHTSGVPLEHIGPCEFDDTAFTFDA